MKKIKILFLFILVFLVFQQLARADKVLLKNGSIFEGQIVKEDSETIWLQLFPEKGSGEIQFLKAQIESIERTPLQEETRKAIPEKEETRKAIPEKKDDSSARSVKNAGTDKPEGFIKKGAIYLGLLLAPVILSLLIMPFASLIQTRLRHLKRPPGLTFIFLLTGGWAILTLCCGLMLASLEINGLAFNFRGKNLIIFLIVDIGIPVFLFLLALGIFYLRKWARIGLIIILGIVLLEGSLSLAFRKDFTREFLADFIAKGTEEPDKAIQKIYEKTGDVFGKPYSYQEESRFEPIRKSGHILFPLLFLLYLIRKPVREAFNQAKRYELTDIIDKRRLIVALFSVLLLCFLADRGYQYMFKRFTQRTDLFVRPARSEGVIKQEGALLKIKDFHRYGISGYQVYLPSGMERLDDDVDFTATLLNMEANRIFSISKMGEGEYKWLRACLYARWNPVLLISKSIASPPGRKLASIKEVDFENRKGVLEILTEEDTKSMRFRLRDDKGQCIECFLSGDEGDRFVDEEVATCIIATLK